MASTNSIPGVIAKLRDVRVQQERIIKETLQEYMQLIFNEALANAPRPVRGYLRFEQRESGFSAAIYSDDNLSAWLEFGTGEFAASYLSGKPNEMQEEAIKFFVSGLGTTPAHPYLFPAFYKHWDRLVEEINRKMDQLASSFNNG